LFYKIDEIWIILDLVKKILTQYIGVFSLTNSKGGCNFSLQILSEIKANGEMRNTTIRHKERNNTLKQYYNFEMAMQE
jgi:hypothetical protein